MKTIKSFLPPIIMTSIMFTLWFGFHNGPLNLKQGQTWYKTIDPDNPFISPPDTILLKLDSINGNWIKCRMRFSSSSKNWKGNVSVTYHEKETIWFYHLKK